MLCAMVFIVAISPHQAFCQENPLDHVLQKAEGHYASGNYH